MQQVILSLLGQGVKLHRFSQDIMVAAHKTAFEIYEEEANRNPAFRKIYTEWSKYRSIIQRWHGLAEHTMENFLYTTSARR